jgi:hypothetical protein
MPVNHRQGQRQDTQGDEERLVHVWRNHHHKLKNKTMIPDAACGKILCMLVWTCCIVNFSMVFAATTNTASVAQSLREHLQERRHRHGGGGGDGDVRHLAEGDFDSINAMLKGQSIDIPLGPTPLEISQSGFTLRIKTMSCFGFSIGDIDLLWNGDNNNNESDHLLDDLDYFSTKSEIPAMVDLIDLNVSCQGTFDFDYLFGSGTGIMNIETTNNDAQIGLVLATTRQEEQEMITAETEQMRTLQQEDNDTSINNNNNEAAVLSDYPSMVPSSTDVGPDDNTIVKSNAIILLESDYPSMVPSSITSRTTDKSNSVVETTSLESDVPHMVPTTAGDPIALRLH